MAARPRPPRASTYRQKQPTGPGFWWHAPDVNGAPDVENQRICVAHEDTPPGVLPNGKVLCVLTYPDKRAFALKSSDWYAQCLPPKTP